VIRLRRPRSPAAALRRAAAGVLLLLALFLALRPAPTAGTPPVTVPVVVAAADLRPGTALTPADVRAASFPAALAPAGATRDPAALSGRVLAAGVRRGEPLTDVRLVGGGLTALLPAGQVAAAIRPADLAVTALVRPGDRVDVLAAAGDGAGGPPAADGARPVAEGALVLAVPSAPGGADGTPPAGGTDADGAGRPAGLLVLAVDRDTAAGLAAASADATLTVTLTPP
jgi:pilus assembly protein CpaB